MQQDIALKTSTSGAFRGGSNSPLPPALVRFTIGKVVSQWATGLYLVVAPKLQGKSLITRGICHEAARRLKNVGILSMFEPGAAPVPAGQSTQGEDTALFAKPDNFLGYAISEYAAGDDLAKWLKFTGYKPDPNEPALLLMDSISDPMRAFAPLERRNQAPAAEGMFPADQSFVKTLDTRLIQLNIVGIGTLNEDLVPFAALLEGACQGMVRVIDRLTFEKKERATGRLPSTYSVSSDSAEAALALMHYPDKIDATQTRSTKDLITS
jgi:hypothetical protein